MAGKQISLYHAKDIEKKEQNGDGKNDRTYQGIMGQENIMCSIIPLYIFKNWPSQGLIWFVFSCKTLMK